MRRQGTVPIKYDPAKTISKMNGKLKLAHANRVFAAMRFSLSVALEATPMWTGDTRANYRWGIGRKGGGYSPYNQSSHWRSKQFPVASSAGADGQSYAALNAMRGIVYSNPYQKFVLHNNVQYENGMSILDLEYGTLTGTAHMPMAKARQAIKARLG